MLNTDGGSVVIGRSEKGDFERSMGGEDVDRLRTFLHEHITPSSLYTVTVDSTPQGDLVTIDVPAGEDRPYVFEGAVFVRRGDHTIAADAATLRRLVQDRAARADRWERRVTPDLSMDDLDRELIVQTVRRAVERRGYLSRELSSDQQALARLGLVVGRQLTNACDVLFGRAVTIRKPQTRVRAVLYRTDRGDDFLDEQLFEGPAFEILERSMAFLQRNVAIASEFKPGQLARVGKPRYPFDALREGLVNALVHRDYKSFSGSVSLSIYPDHLEIWNSGQLPDGVTVRDLSHGVHRSVLVNPDIGHVFYLHELMERVGRGTFKIVQDCKEAGLPPPKWRQDAAGVSLTFFGSGSIGAAAQLNVRQQALLRDLAGGDSIAIREYLDRFAGSVTERSARRDLAGLAEAGYLERVGAAAATTYRRTERTA